MKISTSVNQSRKQIYKVLKEPVNCVYCGRELGQQKTLDHMIPKAVYDDFGVKLEDGVNSVFNFVFSCKKCNNKRGDMPLSLWITNRRNHFVEYFSKYLDQIKGIEINGIDYPKKLIDTTIKILEEESVKYPDAKNIIKQLDKLV